MAAMRAARLGIAGLLIALVVAIPLAGCGGDSNDNTTQQESLQEQLRRARQEGARDQRIKQLEREIRQQRKSNATPAPSSSPPPSSGASGSTSCGGGLSVGPNTTCAFAEQVRAAYPGTGAAFDAYSPSTGKVYTMSCTTGSPHVCRGGNNASVYFP